MSTTTQRPARSWHTIVAWFDTWASGQDIPSDAPQRVDWLRCLPFLGLHVACLAIIWVGWSPFAVGFAVALYLVRMFAITGFYHRYFSHKTFKTSRFAQFMFGLIGNSAVQRGPLWWAAHHRLHHKRSDQPGDVHSPIQHSFLWSHIGWIMSRANFPTHLEQVPELAKFPELRFLDRFDSLVPVALFTASFGLGVLLHVVAPGWGVTGMQLLVWSIVSTVVLFHGTCTINSLSHLFGSRRFDTTDRSRNNPILAVVTLGEGWHNNHHHYPAAARQGFYWWEYDFTYYTLVVLSWCGIIWDLKPVPVKVLESGRGRRAR